MRVAPSSLNTFAAVSAHSPWGYESEPILQTMGRWAARSPSHDPSLPISAASILMSFRTMLDVKRTKGIDASIGLSLDGESFVARLRHGELTIRRAENEGAQVRFTGSPMALASVVYGGRTLADAEAAAALAVEGDRALAKRFVGLFRLPPNGAKVGA